MLLTEPKNASHGDEAVESVACRVQELVLQDEVSGEPQTRYSQHVIEHASQISVLERGDQM